MATTKKASSTSNKQIIEALDDLNQKFSTLNDALIGTTENDKPGLMERVRKLEEWVANEPITIIHSSKLISPPQKLNNRSHNQQRRAECVIDTSWFFHFDTFT